MLLSTDPPVGTRVATLGFFDLSSRIRCHQHALQVLQEFLASKEIALTKHRNYID